MSRRHAFAVIALVAIVALASTHDARAWAPIDSSRPVWGGAAPYEMNSAGSPDLGVPTSEMLVRQGMDDWTRVACTSLRTTYNGQTSRRPSSGDGASTIGWVESGWRYDSNAIGVTGPRWSRNIVEADMELNGQNYTWTTASGRGSTVNAYSIILHEGGHYYGLGHSSDSRATMYFAYSGGISMLNADDQNGICALYPGTGSDCTTTGCPTGQECMGGTCVAMMGDGSVCSPCSSGGDCSGGVCLRYPDGAGYCGRNCTSSAECGSDTCVNISGIGGQCVRLAGGSPSCSSGPSGCTSDAQCPSTERCNTSTGSCEPRPTTGGELGAPCGAGDECRSGLCFAGACSQSCDWLTTTSCPSGWYCSGEATGSCTAGTGVCVAGSAGAGALGAACGAATDCQSLYCASGVCSTPCIPGGTASCAEGFACQVGAAAGCGSCQQSGSMGDPCETSEECTTRLCATIEGDGFCTSLCDTGTCPTGFTCEDAGGARVCVPGEGALGSPCEMNEDCLGGLCAMEGDRSYCTRLCDGVSTTCPSRFECVATDDPSVGVCRPTSSGGCGCSAPGRGEGARGAMLGLGLLAAAVVWRSRRRRAAR
jgi:MYXO-CTERM domain-containing protein